MSKTLYIIGLTGNIATGKSAVAAMLAQLGARVIDADALAHDVIKASKPAWRRIVEEFGRDVLQSDGEINRALLGAQVFADPAALARLEAIVHPEVLTETERLLQELRAEAPSCSTGVQVVVLEAIKLIESGMHRRCDELWVVTSPRQQQIERLMRARGQSSVEAELRIDAQSPQEEKVALADVVIDNSGDLERTRAQVLREWERINHQLTIYRGGYMSSWRKWIAEHPFLTMWAVLAVGMVAIFLLTSRGVALLPSQRLFMALACVALAGLCTWIISWE
jgi:dephospho-CoA kinase